jgi:hypothetical protein
VSLAVRLAVGCMLVSPVGYSGELRPVTADALCVTEGGIVAGPVGRLTIDAPKVRAVCRSRTAQEAELRFTYVGPTTVMSRLGSGETRCQIGIKLRAGDPCNLVYAMWRIVPESKLVVSVKRNSGQHTSAECGNRGYTNIKPRRHAPVPQVMPGSSHVLHARLDGDNLRVSVNGAVVWEGTLGADALAVDGPVGLRSDNGRFALEFLVGAPLAGEATPCPGAAAGD